MPFSRLDNGKIYQRAFGGQSQNFGGDQAARTCAAADRTGHAILHALYQQNIRARTHFFDEFFAIDLVRDDDGYMLGALVLEIETGEPLIIESKTTLLATGGCGQVFRTTTNAYINTGDGMAMALRAGIPLQDMEFFQFHPTGIAGKGMLITEGARGEGGYLVNVRRRALHGALCPTAKDLASRDVVSRAIATEVREGRGCGRTGDHVLLKLDHLGEDVIAQAPARHPRHLPHLPRHRPGRRAHPGLPDRPLRHGRHPHRPLRPGGRARPATGPRRRCRALYAAGECACVSVHGANRLGGNSLLDILVFGRAAGNRHHRVPQGEPEPPAAARGRVDEAMARLARWDRKGERRDRRRRQAELRKLMEDHCRRLPHRGGHGRGGGKAQGPGSAHRRRYGSRTTAGSSTPPASRPWSWTISWTWAWPPCARPCIARRAAAPIRASTIPKRDDVHWMKHSLYQRGGRPHGLQAGAHQAAHGGQLPAEEERCIEPLRPA